MIRMGQNNPCPALLVSEFTFLGTGVIRELNVAAQILMSVCDCLTLRHTCGQYLLVVFFLIVATVIKNF